MKHFDRILNDKELIEYWETQTARADDPQTSETEAKRIVDDLIDLMRANPHYKRVLVDAYAREFPNGPPPGTPGITKKDRQRIAEYLGRARDGGTNCS